MIYEHVKEIVDRGFFFSHRSSAADVFMCGNVCFPCVFLYSLPRGDSADAEL